MTYEMQRTEFEGFPVQYDPDLMMNLNRTTKGIDNLRLQEIGRTISKYAEHLFHPKTEDGYDWFGGLIFKLKYNTRVAVLFPWAQDWDNPETQMDRSINVYSDKKLPTRVVRGLLKKITRQVLEINGEKRINNLRLVISQ